MLGHQLGNTAAAAAGMMNCVTPDGECHLPQSSNADALILAL
jgi:hypothetical protein